MRKLFAILLILCVLPFAALAENIDYDFGDFTLTIPADIAGTINEKTDGQVYFMLYPNYNQSNAFHQNINCVWTAGFESVSLYTDEQVKQLAEGVMDGMISGLKEQGIVVEDAQVLSAEHLSISGKDGIALSYSYYSDYTGAGIDLKTTVYMAQFLVSEPALGTYNLTYTYGDPNDTDAAVAILDSLKWN